jgi:UDP-N-acetylglucosamine 2-epimerase
MRMMSIVGARPQFVKLAAVCRAVARRAAAGTAIEDFIVHTGQHYDPGMSDVFFSELAIPAPDVDLGIGSGTHGAQTARMLEGIERLLLERRPDAVVVYGDTNSTVAGALAASKLHVPVVHVEAGLRSFNRAMPEELNRIATDHLSDLLLAPTPAAMRNLQAEGLAPRAVFVGDVMLDSVRHALGVARERSRIVGELGLQPGRFAVATVHRADNTEPPRLRALLDVLNELADRNWPVVFPVHPRTDKVIRTALADWTASPRLRLVAPLGYLDMLALVDASRLVLTDSGGLQKEAFFVGRPCVTLRDETEWEETVEAGGNIVAGIGRDRILAAVEHWERTPYDADEAARRAGSPFGAGDAAERTVDAILALPVADAPRNR